nr:hypothetical protein CFP56_68639 [Quercus suber]
MLLHAGLLWLICSGTAGCSSRRSSREFREYGFRFMMRKGAASLLLCTESREVEETNTVLCTSPQITEAIVRRPQQTRGSSVVQESDSQAIPRACLRLSYTPAGGTNARSCHMLGCSINNDMFPDAGRPSHACIDRTGSCRVGGLKHKNSRFLVKDTDLEAMQSKRMWSNTLPTLIMPMSIFNGAKYVPPAPTDAKPKPTYSNVELLVSSYRARADQLKAYDDAKNALLEEVIQAYHHIASTQSDAMEQREEEQRRFQLALLERKDLLETGVRVLQDIMNQDPFILCLLDGNAFLFDHALLRAGRQGGERAATLLSDALLEWSQAHVSDFPVETKVAVRVYADLAGLAETCSATGLPISKEHVQDFFQGLMSDHALFDFVDVGSNRNGAVQKLAGQFKMHTMDMHCRQIYLGCLHTENYSALLKEAAETDVKMMTRITLLEGPSPTDGLDELQYPVASFPDILHYQESAPVTRSERRVHSRLVDASADSIGHNANAHTFAPRVTTPYTLSSTTPSPVASELYTHSHTRSDSLSTSRLSQISAVNGRNASPGIWAKVAQTSATLPLTDLTQRYQPSHITTIIRRNRRGHRIDEPIMYDRDEMQKLRKTKWCNQHFIGIGCCHFNASKPEKCPHVHEGHLTTRQKSSLRVIARETPCKRGAACDDLNCIYGHRCPFPRATEGSMRGLGCLNGDSCRFPIEMHGLDNVPVMTTRNSGAF